MTIRTNEVIADFPAVAYARAVMSDTQVVYGEPTRKAVKVQHGDKFALTFTSRSHGVQHHGFQFGSVAAYAMEYHECPIASYNDAKSKSQPTHYAFGRGSTITNRNEEKRIEAALSWDDTILFEGRYFTLKEAGNQNVELVEINS